MITLWPVWSLDQLERGGEGERERGERGRVHPSADSTDFLKLKNQRPQPKPTSPFPLDAACAQNPSPFSNKK